jgi:hypothetical protein
MKIADVHEISAEVAAILGETPLVVTRGGKISGVYLPLDEPELLPQDLRRELSRVLARHLSELLDAQGVTEEEIQQDFDAFRRRRR